MSQIQINPKRNFGGKPLGEYNPERDAFAKFKGIASPAPAVSQKAVDWSRLDLNKVETMITRDDGIAIWNAVQKAKEQGKVLVPNSVHDRMLVETEHYKNDAIKAGYAAWTGTAIIYEEPDKAFGDKVVYTWEHEYDNKVTVQYSLSFTVPEQFRGKVNCALVFDHPNFELFDHGNGNFEFKVSDINNIHIVENIPKEDGWYKYNEQFRIPIGDKMDAKQVDNTMRHWYRITGGAYCGLLARGYVIVRLQFVLANFRPSFGLGVHAVPLADAPKKE